MSFQLRCPYCGPREVIDFRYGGEVAERPSGAPSPRELAEYNYLRRNVAGVQREWWYHRCGCQTWFLAERDTRSNAVLGTWVPEGSGGGPGQAGGGGAVTPTADAVAGQAGLL